jgi:hypothetical protein
MEQLEIKLASSKLSSVKTKLALTRSKQKSITSSGQEELQLGKSMIPTPKSKFMIPREFPKDSQMMSQ